MKENIGHFNAKGLRFAIVWARFNEMITKSLLEGALEGLKRHGAAEENITVAQVPGAFEIPLVAQKLAQSNHYDAIICLGAVIRGATPHFDYVCAQAASGISHVSMSTGIPVIFGVLTTNTIEEAIERAGTKCGNKGFDSAMAAIEMANLLQDLPSPCMPACTKVKPAAEIHHSSVSKF